MADSNTNYAKNGEKREKRDNEHKWKTITQSLLEGKDLKFGQLTELIGKAMTCRYCKGRVFQKPVYEKLMATYKNNIDSYCNDILNVPHHAVLEDKERCPCKDQKTQSPKEQTSSNKLCFYGAGCNRNDCSFRHLDNVHQCRTHKGFVLHGFMYDSEDDEQKTALNTLVKEVNASKVPWHYAGQCRSASYCFGGYDCDRDDCSYYHEKGCIGRCMYCKKHMYTNDIDPNAKKHLLKKEEGSHVRGECPEKENQPLCKYGTSCRRGSCKFLHCKGLLQCRTCSQFYINNKLTDEEMKKLKSILTNKKIEYHLANECSNQEQDQTIEVVNEINKHKSTISVAQAEILRRYQK